MTEGHRTRQYISLRRSAALPGTLESTFIHHHGLSPRCTGTICLFNDTARHIHNSPCENYCCSLKEIPDLGQDLWNQRRSEALGGTLLLLESAPFVGSHSTIYMPSLRSKVWASMMRGLSKTCRLSGSQHHCGEESDVVVDQKAEHKRQFCSSSNHGFVAGVLVLAIVALLVVGLCCIADPAGGCIRTSPSGTGVLHKMMTTATQRGYLFEGPRRTVLTKTTNCEPGDRRNDCFGNGANISGGESSNGQLQHDHNTSRNRKRKLSGKGFGGKGRPRCATVSVSLGFSH